MLYKAIRLGCKKFHEGGFRAEHYDEALKKRSNWVDPDMPSLEEARGLKLFANQWSSHMDATEEDIWNVLNEELPTLKLLRCKTILNVCLDETIDGERVSDLIDRCFKRLAKSNPRRRHYNTGASKILHIIYPEIFVMWDGEIRSRYGYPRYGETPYAEFLRRMQMIARCAIEQVRQKEQHYSDDTTIASLTSCKHTLAKTLDEYNFMKFTQNDDAVWRAEDESCNSP